MKMATGYSRRFMVALFCANAFGWADEPGGKAPLVQETFQKQEALRRLYLASVRARLTIEGEGGVTESFPEMSRRIDRIEGNVCFLTARWSDGKPVFETEEVSRPCRDLITEFSGIRIDEVVDVRGLTPEANGNGLVFTRKAKERSGCLESSEIHVEVEAGVNHPRLIRVTGGPACATNQRGMFRDGSVIEVEYGPVDDVWQIQSMTECHRARFEQEDVVSEVEFFFRTFPVKARLRNPQIRIEKTFADFRRSEKPKRLVANPMEGELKGDAQSSINFDLEPLTKPAEAVKAKPPGPQR